MNELKTKIEEIVSSGKCMELMMLKNTLKTSELEVLQGYYHGDISINHADDYVERVKRLVR